MRFRAFPVSVVVDGVLHSPVLLVATDDATEVWISRTERVARLAPTTARTRGKGELLEGGVRKAMFIAELDDGTRLLVGKAAGCGCGHPLKTFVPPAEVSA